MANSVSRSVEDPALARWIAHTLAADPPRARSLIVTLWGDAIAPHAREVWLAALIALAAPFGVNERAVRTAVFRLAAEGWLAAEAAGRQARYRLTPRGAQDFADASRRIYDPHVDDWDGRWQLLLAPPEALRPRERAALRDTLRWAGFAAIGPGVHARPLTTWGAEPAIDAAVRARLTMVEARDGTGGSGGAGASGAGGGSAGNGGPSLATRVPAQHDLAALARRYRAFLTRFGRAVERFRDPRHPPSDRQAFVARTLLIHAFRRVLLADPLLPASLLPLDWPGAAAYALTRDAYRRVSAAAERHLAGVLKDDYRLAGDDVARRFGGATPATR